MYLHKTKLIVIFYLIWLLLSIDNVTAQTKEYLTTVEEDIYSLEVKTTAFMEKIYPLYDLNSFYACTKQQIVFKKNNVVLNTSFCPAIYFKHKTSAGDSINLLEISFTWVWVEIFKGKKVYHFSAYLCNGDCPEIDMIYSLEGELLLMRYMREQSYFKKYEAVGYTLKDFDGNKEGKMYMIKPFE